FNSESKGSQTVTTASNSLLTNYKKKNSGFFIPAKRIKWRSTEPVYSKTSKRIGVSKYWHCPGYDSFTKIKSRGSVTTCIHEDYMISVALPNDHVISILPCGGLPRI
ncbi:hypothetical protein PV328_011798, partial [Microctonus aethiopoides]